MVLLGCGTIKLRPYAFSSTSFPLRDLLPLRKLVLLDPLGHLVRPVRMIMALVIILFWYLASQNGVAQ